MHGMRQPFDVTKPLSDELSQLNNNLQTDLQLESNGNSKLINQMFEYKDSNSLPSLSLPLSTFQNMHSTIVDAVSRDLFQSWIQGQHFQNASAGIIAFFQSGMVDLTSTVAVPLEKSQLLPRIYVTKSSDETKAEHKECSICLGEKSGDVSTSQPSQLGDIQATMIQLPCNHIFDEECILTWFTQVNTCPLCRLKI
jgi:hypothetical protein